MSLENNRLAQRVMRTAALALAMLFIGISQAAAAENLAGTWEGVWIHYGGSASNLKDTANLNMYDFKTGKWKMPVTAGAIWRGNKFGTKGKVLLQFGDWSDMTGEYRIDLGTPNSLTYGFNFEAGKLTATFVKGGHSRTFTYSQEGDYEYLRWYEVLFADAGNQPGYLMQEYARPFNGTPLKRPGTGGSFFAAEDGGIYTFKQGELYFAMDGKSVISKKDADEDARKWKLEAAPEAFANSFRIVPVGQDDHCLEPGDDGALRLVAKEDKAEGEQYWRFEKKGDGYLIVNVKMGGRGLHIEDKGNGHTIIRSRNEAEAWTLEKQ